MAVVNRKEIRVDYNLIGLGEIAAMLQVKPKTPGIWRYRGVLPDPDMMVGNKPVWHRSTIVEWAKATGRWPHE